MIDGPPQAGRKIWYTKMIVQLIWSINISELEKPHSLKWTKGHLRQQTGKQVIIATLKFWNRNWKCVLLDCYIVCHGRGHTVFKVARCLGHNTQVWACGCWSPLCTLQEAESVSPHLFPVRTRGGLHNTQGDRRVKFMHTFGPLPPKWFSVRPCGGSLNTKIFMAKNKSILEQTNQAISPKTDVVRFSAWVFQEQLI